MRISLNSWSVKPCPAPWRSLIVYPLSSRLHGGSPFSALANCSCRDRAIGFFGRCRSRLGTRAKLRESFVELIGKLHELAHRGYSAARALRRLARNARDDLHGVRDALGTPHLLLGCEGNFLDQLGGLADDAGNRIEGAPGLIGELCAAFHLFRAVFHNDDGLVRFRLDSLD